MTNLVVLACILALSLGANAYLYFKQKRENVPGLDVRAVARDLTALGISLVEIRRVDPTDVLIRSPRGRL